MAASSKEVSNHLVAYLVGRMAPDSPGKDGPAKGAPPGARASLVSLQREHPRLWKIMTQCGTEAGVRQFVLEEFGSDLEEIKAEIEELRSIKPSEEVKEAAGEGERA